jgi:predicted metal-dependent HD superfamily phosphohydrolase
MISPERVGALQNSWMKLLRHYARDIRKEYAWVPDADYRKGRASVIRKILVRPRVFSHQIMFEEGETQARKNLNAELVTLGEQIS